MRRGVNYPRYGTGGNSDKRTTGDFSWDTAMKICIVLDLVYKMQVFVWRMLIVIITNHISFVKQHLRESALRSVFISFTVLQHTANSTNVWRFRGYNFQASVIAQDTTLAHGLVGSSLSLYAM